MTMTWLGRILLGEADTPQRDYGDEAAFGGGFSGSQRVDEDRLLAIPSAYDAINALLNPLKTLPLIFFEKLEVDGKKIKKRIKDNEISLSFNMPNSIQNHVEFFDFMGRNFLIYHNAFAEILSDRVGNIIGYIPFHPDSVSVIKSPTGFMFKVQDGMNQRLISPDKMWHIKAGPYDRDGILGKGPIEIHQNTLSATLAVLDYGARFFKNDAQPGGVLQVKNTLSDEGRENLAKSWRASQGGKNKHRTAVLEEDTEYKEFTVENNKAQFIETRKADDLEIARIWNVPPHRIKNLADATYSNIEQQAIEFVVHSITPLFTLWEASIKSNLIGFDNNIFAEFNILGLLRGDIKTRYEAYAIGRSWGWLSADDVRGLERMNPLDAGGDIYLQPLNFAEAGQDLTKNNSKNNNANSDIGGTRTIEESNDA